MIAPLGAETFDGSTGIICYYITPTIGMRLAELHGKQRECNARSGHEGQYEPWRTRAGAMVAVFPPAPVANGVGVCANGVLQNTSGGVK